MKDRLRDLLISIFPGNLEPPYTRILCFHDIQEPEKLEQKLIQLKADFEIVSLKEIMQSPGQSSVSLTFDDGYESWYDVVLPVLEKLEVPATFFVNSGLLDLKNEEAVAFARNKLMRKDTSITPLTSATLKKMASHPLCTFGGHSTDHYLFTKDIPMEIVSEQITGDKVRLENIIKKELAYFAYPFGQLQNASEHIQESVKQAGYKYAFTIQPGDVRFLRNEYLVPRDSISLDQSYTLWKKWLRGGYDKLAEIKIKLYDLFGVEYR